MFVPDSPNLRLEVVHCTHGSGPAGHPGCIKTLDLLSRTYWWPGISQFTATFVKDCALCFRTKTPCSAPPGFLKPLELPAHPWTDISMDHVVDLPWCPHGGKAYRHIFVVVDQLTKMRHFIPVTSLDTEELVDVFVHTVYKLHGAPDTIISDRGTAFVSDFWEFATNNQVNETTGISPFFANYSYNPCLDIEPAGPCPSALSPHAKKEYL